MFYSASEESHLRKTCDGVQLKSRSLYVSSLSSPSTFKKEKKKQTRTTLTQVNIYDLNSTLLGTPC